MNIRREEEKDYREVEELTREAFWNKYRPGCTEHFILHRYRDDPDFVPELDYVIEENGRIAAHMMYARAVIVGDDGTGLPVLVFGPVSVLPELQGTGYGSKLIEFTLSQAAKLGYGAVAITGDENYYGRFGFESGSSRGVYYAEMPREEQSPFFMVTELIPRYLGGFTGTYTDPPGYICEEADVDEFDKGFSPKKKKKLPGQLF